MKQLLLNPKTIVSYGILALQSYFLQDGEIVVHKSFVGSLDEVLETQRHHLLMLKPDQQDWPQPPSAMGFDFPEPFSMSNALSRELYIPSALTRSKCRDLHVLLMPAMTD